MMVTGFDRAQALELLKKYNKEPFHIRHALTVEGVMREYAKMLGYGEDADFWALVGLMHDVDFEVYPEEHCIKAPELLKEIGMLLCYEVTRDLEMTTTMIETPLTEMEAPTLANMILTGKLIRETGLVGFERIEPALRKVVSAKHAELLDKNLGAIRGGYDF